MEGLYLLHQVYDRILQQQLMLASKVLTCKEGEKYMVVLIDEMLHKSKTIARLYLLWLYGLHRRLDIKL